MYGTEEVVLFVVEHCVCHCHAGCNEFGDASLDECLRRLRVFQLVANGNSLACPDEFGQIGVEGVMGETCHCDALGRWVSAVVAPRQGNAKYFGGDDGILGIGFVEVATTEQQQCLGMFRLEVVELLHHRRQHLSVVRVASLGLFGHICLIVFGFL